MNTYSHIHIGFFVVSICPPLSADAAKVKKARQMKVGENEAQRISEVLRVLADPTRIKIISSISNQELRVCEIALALESSQSLISHQLQALRHLKIVKLRKNGRNTRYSLNDLGVLRILEECQKHAAVKSGE